MKKLFAVVKCFLGFHSIPIKIEMIRNGLQFCKCTRCKKEIWKFQNERLWHKY